MGQKKTGKGGRQKAAGGDTPSGTLGPRRLTGKARKQELEAQLARERAEFEKRRRRDVAKAAIELDPVDILILEHQIFRPWLTQEQIGELVGLCRTAVSERVNAEKFKRAIHEAGRSALEIFESNKSRAARKLGKLIDDPDSRVSIRACIAHMWPHIHAEGGKSGDDDFVKLLQEAAEQADAEAAAKTGTDGGGGGASTT